MIIKKIMAFNNIIHFMIFSFIYNISLVFIYNYSGNINNLIVSIYGTIDLFNISNIIKMIFWLLPQLIIIMCTGNIFEDRLLKNAALIFTRTNKRYLILLKTIINIMLNIILICLIQIAFIVISSKLFNISIDLNFDSVLLISRLILYYFLIVLIVNCSSLFGKSIYGVYIVLVAQVSMIYLSNMLLSIDKTIIKCLPTSIGIISINDIGIGLNNVDALIYCSLLIIVVIICTFISFYKKEILY